MWQHFCHLRRWGSLRGERKALVLSWTERTKIFSKLVPTQTLIIHKVIVCWVWSSPSISQNVSTAQPSVRCHILHTWKLEPFFFLKSRVSNSTSRCLFRMNMSITQPWGKATLQSSQRNEGLRHAEDDQPPPRHHLWENLKTVCAESRCVSEAASEMAPCLEGPPVAAGVLCWKGAVTAGAAGWNPTKFPFSMWFVPHYGPSSMGLVCWTFPSGSERLQLLWWHAGSLSMPHHRSFLLCFWSNIIVLLKSTFLGKRCGA